MLHAAQVRTEIGWCSSLVGVAVRDGGQRRAAAVGALRVRWQAYLLASKAPHLRKESSKGFALTWGLCGVLTLLNWDTWHRDLHLLAAAVAADVDRCSEQGARSGARFSVVGPWEASMFPLPATTVAAGVT